MKRIFIFLITLAAAIFIISGTASAQYQLETKLPNIPSQPSPSEGLPQYINYIFIFGLGLVTVLALGQMMFGGINYIMAAGNASKVENAKDYIKSALFGLGLIIASYLLLRTINPDLVNINNPSLKPNVFKGQPIQGESIQDFITRNGDGKNYETSSETVEQMKKIPGAEVTEVQGVTVIKTNGKIITCFAGVCGNRPVSQ